jgi:hypothetical protein
MAMSLLFCQKNTELVLSLSKRHGITPKDFNQKALVSFSALELWWLFFFATEARKHGIPPKNLKMKALVSFSALELWWLFFFATETRNSTKKSQNEGFGEF